MSDFVLSDDLAENYKQHEKRKFDDEVEFESYFPLTNSILIIDGWTILEPLIKEDQKIINDFNKKLREEAVNYYIRGVHKTKVNSMIYYYNGIYLFEGHGDDRKYIGKLDIAGWREILSKEVYKKIGDVPRTNVPNIRFTRVESMGKSTGNIIVPAINFLDGKLRDIFANCQVYKIM